MLAIEALGRYVISALTFFGGTTLLHLRTLVHILRGAVSYRLTVQQMSHVGVASLPIVGVTMLFSGMVFSYHVAAQAHMFGVSSYVGWAVAEVFCRELGPALTAIVVAARAGSAMAAELGTMKVTEQIDALRTMAVDPVQYLVVPRYLAAMVTVPMLAFIGDVEGVLGGYLMSLLSTPGTAHEYFSMIPAELDAWTIIAGIIKALFFGIIIAIISCHQGLTCKRAAEDVGHATMRAVVLCIMAIYASDLVLTMVLYP